MSADSPLHPRPAVPTRRWPTVAWCGLVLACAVASWQALSVHVDGSMASWSLHGIEFERPRWLLWMVAAWSVPLVLPWRLTDLSRPQVLLQTTIRMLLLAVIAVALAGPRSRREQPRPPQVIHVVDRSESVPDALLEAARAGIRHSHQALTDHLRQHPPPEGQAPPDLTVIAFDDRAERLGPRQPIVRKPASATVTDLHAALQLALGLMDGRTVPHIVLWTDGVETRGDALQAVPALKAAAVQVHTPRLPPLAPVAEVLVERLEVPAKVRAGVSVPLAAVVQSTQPATVRCQLSAGRAAKVATPPPVTQAIAAGVQRVELGELRLREAGTTDLAVDCSLTAGADRFASNNHVRSRVVVEERPKILYVEGGGERQALPLLAALQDDFEVEVRPGDGLPRALSGLLPYQAIVLSDVPRVSTGGVPLLTDGDMRNLEAYVRQGRGLLVVGGENSLGSGGYQDTYFDRQVLPVHMDVESKLEQPSIALMLCIDRSGSMAGPKMELAKAAAVATAKALAVDDLIGVVAFDAEARLAVRLQRAGNAYRIESDIGKLSPSGGTHIYPALDQAFQQLSAAQAKVKHVIVLTDGQAPRAGIDALVRQMRRSAITVSSVGVGSDVDRSLLEAIADRGGGRSHFTDRPDTLPRIFVRETKLLAGQSVVEQSVRARRAAGLGRVDLLRGVDLEAAPALRGFLPTRTKAGAEEVLRLSNGKPLLVRWRLGGGKVSVWTSDLKGRWASAWLNWAGYARLARQTVRDVLQEEVGLQAQVRLVRERQQLRVVADALDESGGWLGGLAGQAVLQDPQGRVQRLALTEVAAGRYEATAALDAFGAWDVLVQLRASVDQPVLASGRATAVHPWPDEHRIAQGEQDVAAALVQATGGQQHSDTGAWLHTRGLVHTAFAPLWPQLVQTALALLVLDVLLRRVRIGRAPVTRWHALRRTK
jgi:Ca-activated chloride channel family protein